MTVFCIVGLGLMLGGCRKEEIAQEYRAGGIYSVQDKHGYGVVKILVVDARAVHIRIYKNKFSQRPMQVDLKVLTLGTIHDPEGFGMGHLPLARATFASWQPVLITQTTVSADELAGYDEWKKANGGVWGEH